MDRRQFLGMTAGAGVAAALPHTTSPVVGRVGAADVERLQAQATDLLLDVHHHGVSAYAGALDQLVRVRTLIDDAPYSETVGLGLRRVAGHLHYLAGVSAFDDGRPQAAWSHLNEAFRIARTTDDGQLAVLTLEEMSVEASQCGSARESVELAQEAGRVGRGFATPGVLSRLAAREALGRAQAGDTAHMQALLVRAERLLDDDRELDDGSWLSRSAWNAGRVNHAVGASHLALGAPLAAERSSRVSVATCRPDYPRSKAVYSAQLAAALIASGKIDEGAAVVVGTLAQLDGVHSPRTIGKLCAPRPALAAHASVSGVPAALHTLNQVR